MEPYANRKTYELRYSDLDFKDDLSLPALLSLVQESAGASAEELGFGYHALKSVGCGFIVVNTYCEFLAPVGLGDTVTVETWPLPPRHVIFERDYRVTNAAGKQVAALASRWCLVDLDSFSLLTPDRMGEVHARCPYRDEKAVEPAGWKIPKLTDGREVYRTVVRAGLCDHYLHANNTRYAELFLDCFTMEELAARSVKRFQIAYSKQAKEGKTVVFYREDFGDVSICEARADGELLSQFRVEFSSAKENK